MILTMLFFKNNNFSDNIKPFLRKHNPYEIIIQPVQAE